MRPRPENHTLHIAPISSQLLCIVPILTYVLAKASTASQHPRILSVVRFPPRMSVGGRSRHAPTANVPRLDGGEQPFALEIAASCRPQDYASSSPGTAKRKYVINQRMCCLELEQRKRFITTRTNNVVVLIRSLQRDANTTPAVPLLKDTPLHCLLQTRYRFHERLSLSFPVYLAALFPALSTLRTSSLPTGITS